MGDPSQRRRVNNNDRVDASRRRADMRRRSSSGWEATDYSRRRGYSGSTVAQASALGFAAGLAVGTRIQQPGHPAYYYHQHGWSDSYGVYHQSGYYGADGYYYRSAYDIGYCPPTYAPDYSSNQQYCAGGYHRRNNNMSVAGVALLVCCIFAIWWFVPTSQGGDGGGGGSYGGDYRAPLLSVGDPATLEGQTVARGNAILFLKAVEAEYVDGVEGQVGNVFDRIGNDNGDANKLACEEDAIRNADDARGAVMQLAMRWDMRFELHP